MSEHVAPETHWPELLILVLVVNDNRKDTSSTEGMQQSAKTCEFMEVRGKVNNIGKILTLLLVSLQIHCT